MTRSGPLRVAGLLLLGSTLTGSKCVSYDERLTVPSDPNNAGDADGDADPGDGTVTECLPPEPVYDLNEMRRAACVGLRCASQRASAFWFDAWEDHDVVRVVRFRDDAPGPRFDVTDEQGAPSSLAFVQGTPVTLIVRNEGDAGVSRAYDFTAPLLFHHVAWRDIATSDGTYEAATFDAVLPGYASGQRREVVIAFVPIERGTFDVYSSGGVVNGTAYSAIASGPATPDLATGDAGQGMKTTLTITGDSPLTLFRGSDVDRDARLDDDPRRAASDPVWDPGNLRTVTIDAVEAQNPDTGGDIFTFQWSSLAFPVNVAHVIELHSVAANRYQHNFTALGLMRGSVNRGVSDSQTEVRAASYDSINIVAGKTIRIYFVPTVIARYEVFCQLGIVFSSNGQPDLQSGHAGAGMHDVVEVVP